jgi:hypothetical protein
MGVRKMAIQKVVVRMMVVTVVLLGLGLLIWSLSSPDGKVSRGDVPGCHKVCLSDHTKNIDKMVAQYEVTRDKMEFQDQVDQAIARYRECSDNCRVVYPVK